VNALSAAAEELSKSGAEAEVTAAAAEKLKTFRDKWNELETVVTARVKLGQSYVAFHKKAQQVLAASSSSQSHPPHPLQRNSFAKKHGRVQNITVFADYLCICAVFNLLFCWIMAGLNITE